MRRVFTTPNTLVLHDDPNRPRDLDNNDLVRDLQNIKLYANNDGIDQLDYLYNLQEYPTRVKKLFIKGGSNKKVPRQVLNITTNSFETSPSIFNTRFNTRFEELIPDVAVPSQAPPAREELAAQVERTVQVEKERDQAIAQVQRAEERTTRAEVRANRAETDRDRARARPLVVHDEVLEEME